MDFFACPSYPLEDFAQRSDLPSSVRPPPSEIAAALRSLVGVLHDMTAEQQHERPTIPQLLARLRPSPP